MTNPIVFSPQVIKDLRALPQHEQIDVVSALIGTILGHDLSGELSGTSAWAYTMLATSVRMDSERYQRTLAARS